MSDLSQQTLTAIVRHFYGPSEGTAQEGGEPPLGGAEVVIYDLGSDGGVAIIRVGSEPSDTPLDVERELALQNEEDGVLVERRGTHSQF